MGFSRDVGLGVYNATTLAASVYGVFGLTGKAEAWRLFRYLPGDYRKVQTMSPGKLSMKVLGGESVQRWYWSYSPTTIKIANIRSQ
jgi:hypothetical protein